MAWKPSRAPAPNAINPKAIDARDVKDFIAKVKAAPGKYNYASTGNGAGTHLAFAEFTAKAGLDMVHVPYKGSPDAIQSVLNGDTWAPASGPEWTRIGRTPDDGWAVSSTGLRYAVGEYARVAAGPAE